MENYYDILEVSQKASKEIITKAYRTLVKKYHPDANSKNNKPIDDEKIKKINEAYDVLCDEYKRKCYDMELESAKKEQENDIKIRYEKIVEQNRLLQRELSQLKQRYEINYNTQQGDNTYQQNVNTSNSYVKNENYNDNLQREIDRRINQSVNKAYQDAYVQRMRDYGYRVVYKKTFKERLRDIIAIAIAFSVVILIIAILWQFPSFREYVESNEIFNIIFKLFRSE